MKNRKKLRSVIFSLALIIGMIPMNNAYAAEPEQEEIISEVKEESVEKSEEKSEELPEEEKEETEEPEEKSEEEPEEMTEEGSGKNSGESEEKEEKKEETEEKPEVGSLSTAPSTKCTVTFDMNIEGLNETEDVEYNYNEPFMDTYAVPWSSSYTSDLTLSFLGWYTQPEGGTFVSEHDDLTEALTGGGATFTLYAHWRNERVNIGESYIDLNNTAKKWIYDEEEDPVIRESDDDYNLAWDPATHTLELNGLTVNECRSGIQGGTCAFTVYVDLEEDYNSFLTINVKLSGENRITMEDCDEPTNFYVGIYSCGIVNFIGNGTLNVTAGEAKNAAQGAYALAICFVSVSGECRLNLKSRHVAILSLGMDMEAAFYGSDEFIEGDRYIGLAEAVPGKFTLREDQELSTYVLASDPTKPCKTLVMLVEGAENPSEDYSPVKETVYEEDNTVTSTWIPGADGSWRYYKSNGTLARNEWLKLSYNGKEGWYHFGTDGKMNTGWLQDTDGSWYFLNRNADGEKGSMQTGWMTDADDGYTYYLDPATGKMAVGFVEIDGKKYHFNENGPEASGWKQNEAGEWVYEKKSVIPLGALIG